MRYLLAVATAVAILAGGTASQAAHVVYFEFGSIKSSNTLPNGTTITLQNVVPNNGAADNSAGLITEVVDPATAPPSTFSIFEGSFSSDLPIDVMTLEFAAMSDSPTDPFDYVVEFAGNQLDAGSLPGAVSSVTLDYDLSAFGNIKFGNMTVTLEDASFVDPAGNLPTTNQPGFLAVTGTAVPEPSMAVALATMGCIGGLVVRRRRKSRV